jgi:hypothetical protein
VCVRESVRECVCDRESDRECVCVFMRSVCVTGMSAFIFIFFFPPLVFVCLQFCMYECICLQVCMPHRFMHT